MFKLFKPFQTFKLLRALSPAPAAYWMKLFESDNLNCLNDLNGLN
jgi:hypothetical protein